MKKFFEYACKTGGAKIAVCVCAGALIAAIGLVAAKIPAAQSARLEATRPAVTESAARPQRNVPRFAQLGAEVASRDVQFMADWVADSGDASGRPFVIIDKKGTKVFVFDAEARLMGASPVLLGAAPGDDSAPGIGEKPLSQVLPAERTTPAGRFVGERGHNARGEDVVWVDYDAAVSMHRVLTTNKAERRLERLATPSVEDNRISFGCINVPVVFYEKYLQPTFAQKTAMIYVLPEVKSLRDVFGAYDVAAVHGMYRNQVQGPQRDALMILLFALRN